MPKYVSWLLCGEMITGRFVDEQQKIRFCKVLIISMAIKLINESRNNQLVAADLLNRKHRVHLRNMTNITSPVIFYQYAEKTPHKSSAVPWLRNSMQHWTTLFKHIIHTWQPFPHLLSLYKALSNNTICCIHLHSAVKNSHRFLIGRVKQTLQWLQMRDTW